MGAYREPLPSVTLALILTLGDQSEVIPIFHRDLLVDAAMIALRDLVSDADRETNPLAAADKAEQAVAFSRVLRRIIPEIRALLSCAPMPEKVAWVQ